MIIPRPQETGKIIDIPKWIMVYGRRKTGKTFLVQNFIHSDEYFFVKKDKNILTKNNEVFSYETFLEILRRSLQSHKVVVVDEFHRLGSDFFDFLHFLEKKGKLILLSSTLFLSKKILSGQSALLGIFAEVPVGLIRLEDTLAAVRRYKLPLKEQLELAILLQEPLAIDYFKEGKSARELLATIVLASLKTTPALIGEIFLEEEKELSAAYEGILRAIATGNINSGEISSYLFSLKVINKDDPSIIQQYLNNLISFGMIRRIEIFNKKRFAYKLASPLARIFYYADEKYNLSERKVGDKEILAVIDQIMPRIVEDTVREFLAEKEGLHETIIESADFEVDGYLLKFKKPQIALEVKWKELDTREIIKVEEHLASVAASRKILFVPDKKGIKSLLEVMDVTDFFVHPTT